MNRAFAIGIILNLAFVFIEAIYGWKVNSLSLLADAGHNLSDVAGLILAWAALLAGKLKPNPKHTYGWQRASILAAFSNAIFLLLAMGALSLEAISNLRHPLPTDGATIMAVAGVGILINTLTAWMLREQVNDLNIQGAFLHMAADAAVSAGVFITGGLYFAFGWVWLDPIASILIALVIVVSTSGLLRQSVHLLFDGVPFNINPVEVRSYLENLDGVSEIHDLHIWGMSTNETALTVHLIIPDGHPRDAFLQKVTDSLRARFGISHATIQIEKAPILHEFHHR
ncbi:cation diffusion facilitator family transporter [Legionella anisa]|uniref:Cation transporter n=1 Tax=Legionella anisa TaxID=28082 RepID=A0AAX0WQK9_9GAMM|nr:cation diffusion facilitator family transporter [Legionella anisa]KTC67040.1 cation efflux system protein [Legionella anisa]MCW8424122.1 cation diffusion facilitator family transporter [Legionella anisa]MCW8447645.1 cation diffusion facilitator family transporter [Legionella anisa]PNL60395.1 cation transporter [Legionella anisa]UAK80844.1 cation diffusion facilitator family transporter [Legionella anisa]